jgi:hypothetical protein
LQVRLPVRVFVPRRGSHYGSQVVHLRYGWGFVPWLRRRRHLLRSPGGLPGSRRNVLRAGCWGSMTGWCPLRGL